MVLIAGSVVGNPEYDAEGKMAEISEMGYGSANASGLE